MPLLKKKQRVAVLGVALMMVAGAAVIWFFYESPLRTEVIPTASGEIEVSISRLRAVTRTVGTDASSVWRPEKGKMIIDAMFARRTVGEDPKLLVITGPLCSKYGDGFEILAISEGGPLQRHAFESMRGMNPWKLQTADVDGDGVQDISITMFKKTRFHPVMANRPFLYYWKNGYIEPLWRGSRLSRPFGSYVFSDINNDGRDELIATEYLQDGTEVLQAYYWKGFGFEGYAVSRPYPEITGLAKNLKTHSVEVNKPDSRANEVCIVVCEGDQLNLIQQ